eukprot:gene5427-12601_t
MVSQQEAERLHGFVSLLGPAIDDAWREAHALLLPTATMV